eukprot:GILJ01002157.1.p1 GENE.GILJ01002157.1~~GILJ01002157.1.p1  ORF type:complete len:325 (+),score=54.49 GILJ01002157.1:25-999(+)
MDAWSWIFVLLVAVVAYKLLAILFPSPDLPVDGKAVVITGCDSGFGRMLAEQLDKEGFRVFALCLTQNGVKALTEKCSSSCICIEADITKQEDLDRAVALIQQKTKSLWAIVNNAGIGVGFHFDWTPMETYRQTMDVNFFAMVNVTKMFWPMVAATQGRVVNMTSVAGRLPVFGGSAYCASKHAAEAFSDCLRLELNEWGIKVCIIEPSFMKTPIVSGAKTMVQKIWEAMPPTGRDKYGQTYFDHHINTTKRLEFISGNPQQVVDAYRHAIINSKPLTRYVCGFDAKYFLIPVLSRLPTALTDLMSRCLIGGPKPFGLTSARAM